MHTLTISTVYHNKSMHSHPHTYGQHTHAHTHLHTHMYKLTPPHVRACTSYHPHTRSAHMQTHHTCTNSHPLVLCAPALSYAPTHLHKLTSHTLSAPTHPGMYILTHLNTPTHVHTHTYFPDCPSSEQTVEHMYTLTHISQTVHPLNRP